MNDMVIIDRNMKTLMDINIEGSDNLTDNLKDKKSIEILVRYPKNNTQKYGSCSTTYIFCCSKRQEEEVSRYF